MLIAFGGLPGTGKTAVAQTLARKLAAVYLLAGYAVAKDNLCLGLTVVADSVNSLHVTRSAWRSVALEAGVRIFEIELIAGRRFDCRSCFGCLRVQGEGVPRQRMGVVVRMVRG
jgi:predicted kinase